MCINEYVILYYIYFYTLYTYNNPHFSLTYPYIYIIRCYRMLMTRDLFSCWSLYQGGVSRSQNRRRSQIIITYKRTNFHHKSKRGCFLTMTLYLIHSHNTNLEEFWTRQKGSSTLEWWVEMWYRRQMKYLRFTYLGQRVHVDGADT